MVLTQDGPSLPSTNIYSRLPTSSPEDISLKEELKKTLFIKIVNLYQTYIYLLVCGEHVMTYKLEAG